MSDAHSTLPHFLRVTRALARVRSVAVPLAITTVVAGAYSGCRDGITVAFDPSSGSGGSSSSSSGGYGGQPIGITPMHDAGSDAAVVMGSAVMYDAGSDAAVVMGSAVMYDAGSDGG